MNEDLPPYIIQFAPVPEKESDKEKTERERGDQLWKERVELILSGKVKEEVVKVKPVLTLVK